MKIRASMLALAAGGVFAAAAIAEDTQVTRIVQMPKMQQNADGTWSPASPFSTNAIQIVYDNTDSAFGATGASFTMGNTTHVLDDVNFTPGGWATTTGRAITDLTISYANVTGAVRSFDVVLRFWDTDDVDFTNTTSAIATGAVPLGAIRFAVVNANSGFVYLQPLATLATPIAIPDGDAQIYVEAGVYETGTDTLLPLADVVLWGTENGNNGPSVGSNAPAWMRDRNNDGIFQGAAAPGPAPAEHTTTNVVAGGAFGAYPIEIQGDVPPPPPPASTDLGCIADGATAVNQANDNLTWYQICLTGAADDISLQFLDIDTEGSAADVDVALYDANGLIVGQAGILGIDRNDGSGENAQLSFGIGRRGPALDSKDYDGRDGELPAGTYFLAVAPALSGFAPGFIATPAAGTGGAVTINLNTNVNGAALAASVAPTVDPTLDLSLIPFGFGAADTLVGAIPGTATGTRGVQWVKFAVDAPGATTAGGTYLDMDFSVNSTPTADGVAYIFDTTGNVLENNTVFVGFSDDEGPAALPQFSFGSASPARVRGANVEDFAGENLDLAAGTYYVALALFATDDIGLSTDDRWHVRGTSGSNLDLAIDFYTGTGVTCDTIDFNNDGLFPDDQDLIDFLSVSAGGPCSNDPNCNDIDFNNDGLFPDDADLIAFLNVAAGGNC